MQSTSQSLLGRLVESGDNTDWLKFREIYRPFIQGVIRTYPGLASQADDVTQDVMLVLMRELPAFQRRRTGSFRAWLRGITVNQLRKALRDMKRHETRSDLETQISELADPASIAAKRWDEEHDRVVLAKAMDVVKKDFKDTTWQAFLLYGVENMPPADIAESLGISVNAVLLAKSRVLRRVREEVDGLVDA